MKKLLVALFAGLAVLGAPATGKADISLSLSSPDDVNHLTVGQAVTFNVDLSGVDPSDSATFLSFLAATVRFDSTLLGSPSPAVAGSIVPDPTNFTLTPGLFNAADGFYDAVFGLSPSDPISMSSTSFPFSYFFSFTVTTLAAGDGTITFEAAAATFASDPDQNNQITPDTSSLGFHIGGSAIAVPEPGAHVALLTCALAGVATYARRRLGHGRGTGRPAGDSPVR